MPLFVKLLLLGIGLVFLAAGLAIGVWGTLDARANAARAEGLAPRNAAAVDAAAVGTEVLVEAAVSPRNGAVFRDFVAYSADEFTGVDDDGDPEWDAYEQVTPRLLLEAGGLIAVENEDYRLEGAHATYQDPGPLTRGDLARPSTKRYEGLVAGGTVMAIGTIVAGPEGNELRAELIYAGTREAYIAGQRQTAIFLPIFGGIFALVGAIMTGFGVYAFVKG